jgi:hypothetical protein
MIDSIKQIESLPGTLYIERHFDNIPILENHQKIMGELLPNPNNLIHWGSFNNPEKNIICGLNGSGISTATEDFIRFAHYINVDLLSAKSFNPKLKNLVEDVNIYKNNVSSHFKEKHKVDTKNIYDFIFDYSRQNMFHRNGIMSSGIARTIIMEDNALKGSLDWLQNKE